jgi:hypothetical protein
MSLIDDPTTEYLWQRVQNIHSYENAAQSLWHHIYTKVFFTDKKYIVDYEDPPTVGQQNQRKVDQTVRELDEDWGEAFVLLFHEIKKMECTPADLEHVEKQAFDACESFCLEHNIPQVYAQTSIGSRARFFLYQPGKWEPKDGFALGVFDAYQEISDPAGEKYVISWLNYIKSIGPAKPKT